MVSSLVMRTRNIPIAIALVAAAAVVEPLAAQTAPARGTGATRAVPRTSEPKGAAAPGQTFKECRNCPEMMVIPADEGGPLAWPGSDRFAGVRYHSAIPTEEP